LVSNADPLVVIRTHFVDSLSCLESKAIRPEARLLDIGAGAGFPGIPLKIYYPALQVTALDTVAKKISFLRQLCRTLGLSDVTCLAMRAEQLSVAPAPGQHPPTFDVIVSRAVGSLPYLARLAMPLLAPEGCLLVQRGPQAMQEVAIHDAELRQNGLQFRQAHEIHLSWFEHLRYLVELQLMRPA
jgi:16S rRNA (guanine527-N7)-methyltransferase